MSFVLLGFVAIGTTNAQCQKSPAKSAAVSAKSDKKNMLKLAK